jgi:hypothetical protein
MKWISVKDKLPEINEDNLYLTTDGKSYCIKRYKDDGWQHNVCECWCYVYEVTQYILLPKPSIDK